MTRRSARALIAYLAASIVVGLLFLSSPGGRGYSWRNEDARRPSASTDARAHALRQLTAVKSPDPEYRKDQPRQNWAHTAAEGFDSGHMWYSETKLRELTACAVRNDCHPNAYKVVIFSGWYCHTTFFRNFAAGEATWCNSMRNSLDRQGYTVLLARDNHEYAYHLYRQIPDLVVAVIGDTRNGHGDFADFFKTKERPDGIPAWKFFHFGFFGTRDTTIVGNKWVVHALPEWKDYKGQEASWTYLGYDLPLADPKEVVPFHERPHRVWILAKDVSYFYDNGELLPWPLEFFERADKELKQRWPDFEFVGSFNDKRYIITQHAKDKDAPKKTPRAQPKGIVALGGKVGGEEGTSLDAAGFRRELANSRVLLGIGRPTVSPSPYQAFMLGVPFINPYIPAHGDPDGTGHQRTWHWTQHDSLHFEEPPYVYNVRRRSYEAFLDAIIRAMETEAPPKRMEWITEEAQDRRMREFMEFDWRSLAAEILEQRLAGNETQHGKGPWIEQRYIPEKPGIFEL
ncbi:hypothetical protein Q8F55_000558 [Vanrija albida]|uniref:Alpha-1,6-mannosyl-glycoprotein 6-beta-N-acetylglucosaminyltransferase n=1 Tax=Vanrija albida TaxID=181172 RepID=A0ABR3QDL8_9TREE